MSSQQEEPLLLSYESQDERTSTGKKSYTSLAIFYLLYNLQYAIVIPAGPVLVLQLMHDDSSKAAYMLGMIAFVRYFVEFFFSPICGQLSDIKGRKTMLMAAFAACLSEYMLCMLFPTIGIIFLSKIVSGMFDSGIATGITMASDLAFYNEDEVAVAYGLLGAMIGIAFVLGPVSGGVLCGVSVQVCYLVGAALALSGIVLGYCFLEETMDLNHCDIHFSTCPDAEATGGNYFGMDTETATNTAINANNTATSTNTNSNTGGSGGAAAPLSSPEAVTSLSDYDFEYHLPPTPQATPQQTSRKKVILSSPYALSSPVAANSDDPFERSETVYATPAIGNVVASSKVSEELPPLSKQANEMLEKLNLKRRTTLNFSEANPIPALMLHFSNKKLRQLSIALFCSGIAASNFSIFYMYMFDRFSAGSIEVGAFISFFALVAVIVQSFGIRSLVPDIWSESTAVLWGVGISSLQALAFAFVTDLWMMFVVAIVCALHTINDPTLRAIVVNESRDFEHKSIHVSRSVSSTGMTHQGNLQGVLGSLRTLSTGLGSLMFNGIYGYSVKVNETWLAWVVGAGLYGLCFVYLWSLFDVQWRLQEKKYGAHEFRAVSDDDCAQQDDSISSGFISITDSDGDCNSSQKLSGWDFEAVQEVLSAAETATESGSIE